MARLRKVALALFCVTFAARRYAFGADELKPISRKAHQNFGMGLTLVDSLDAMIIMGLEEHYQKARTWNQDHLKFGLPVRSGLKALLMNDDCAGEQENINLFETTIRILGGLLSAYGLKGDKCVLASAAS